MKPIIYIMLTSLLMSVARADVVFLPKDKPAPFEGFLFPREKTQAMRLDAEHHEQLKRNYKLLEQDNELYEKRIALRDKQIDVLSTRVIDQKDEGMFSKVGFFILGAVISGGVAFGLSKAIR